MEYTVEKYEERIAEEVKELQNMGMEIDIEAFRRFYYHFDRDHHITGLHLPSNLRNQTLQSVLTVAYGSHSSSDGSSNDTDYDESKFEEWSQVFTKDGHFRLDQILPLLSQPPQLSRGNLGIFLQNLNCSRLALAHYNEENKQDPPYELVMPVMCSVFRTYGHRYYHHVNFFAKRKRHDTPELFFAELWGCRSKDEDPVLRCCILKPNHCGHSSPHSSEDAVKVRHFPPTWIFHPEDLTCRCTVESNCYFDSDDDI